VTNIAFLSPLPFKIRSTPPRGFLPTGKVRRVSRTKRRQWIDLSQ
jgi:hypothetical protein